MRYTSIHGESLHQQAITKSFIAENFMGIVGNHWGKAIEKSGVWR